MLMKMHLPRNTCAATVLGRRPFAGAVSHPSNKLKGRVCPLSTLALCSQAGHEAAAPGVCYGALRKTALFCVVEVFIIAFSS